tara:strand:- start:147 stop:638 length:492 start_codon:yes stop_codon:yes gene_type:complete
VELEDGSMEGKLMELLGNVGEYPAEFQACQLHFRIKPCRYPVAESWGLLPVAELGTDARLDCMSLATVSIDNASTKDIDDALSFGFAVGGADSGKHATIGIHVADVASRMACDSPLFRWAKERGGSAYHSGVPGEEGQGGPGGSVPMLPPELAHGELSLNQAR